MSRENQGFIGEGEYLGADVFQKKFQAAAGEIGPADASGEKGITAYNHLHTLFLTIQFEFAF